MQTADFNLRSVLFVSIEPGEDVLECLERIIEDKGILSATVLSAYGTFDRINLHWVATTTFPPVEHYESNDGPFEVLGIGGVIVDGTPHLHVTVSNRSGAYGGHLHKGCRVLYLFEMTIGLLSGPAMHREPIPEKKIQKLVIGEMSS